MQVLFLTNNLIRLTSFPSVAVVILNWNGRKFLEKFLPFLLKSHYPNLQLIVADNGSTDDSVAFLRENYREVKVLISQVNEGFAKGYNTALRQVSADYYALLNSDVEVTNNWIEPVIELMERNPNIAACQPKMLDYNHKSLFEYAGAAGGWLDSYGYPFCRGRVFETCEEDRGQYDHEEPIFWASGASMFVRSRVFYEIRGFDEFFFAHQEEIDLCWRMQLAGYEIYSCPRSVIFHVGGGTLPMGNKRKIFLNFRNNLVMLGKNYTWAERILKIPFRIILDLVSAAKNLFSGDAGYFFAVIKAHFAFAGWLFSKKGNWFPFTRKANPRCVYNGNIVWQYFIKRKRTFSEITGFKK